MAESRPVELSKHETDVLLGLYSGCECLWNIKNPDYKVKKIRIGALRTVVNGMRLETGQNYNISQMEATLEQIREEYRRELQRAMEAEKVPDNGYKSQWRWFHFLDSFLRDNILNAQTLEMEVTSGEQDGVVRGEDSNDNEDFYCPLADSGDDEYQPPTGKDKVLMQVLPNPTSSKSSKSTSRPVRSSSRRVSASTLLNGVDYSEDFDIDDGPSRKKRRSAAVSSSSKNRNSSSHSKHSSSKTSSRLFVSDSDKPNINEQMADTLKSMQVLLATTLSDQDQPSLVFARHIANELQQITDYTLRKQCMLDVQQLILRYQTKQQASESTNIKFEGRCEQGEGVVGVSGSRPTASSSHTADDNLLLYFDTP